MNICCLNPPYAFKVVREGRCQHETAIWDSVYPPLALATIAAALRADHRVGLIDAIAEGLDVPGLLARLERDRPDLIIASISTPTVASDLEILKACREKTGAKIAVFGVHATYFADELIKNDFIDYILLHDPEAPAVRIAAGGAPPYEGTVCRVDGRPVRTPADPRREEKIPIPAWDLVNLDFYKIPIRRKRYVLVSTARGCPFDCSFCVAPFYSGRKVRFRSVDEVIEELKAVRKLVADVFFYTDLFTFNKKYVLELCRRMIEEKLDLSWICNSRVDTFDAETAAAMKKAGCWLISFGVESGSQDILDRCGKKITVEQSRSAAAAARSAGLISIGHFVLGIPGETEATLRRTIRFSRELDLDFVEFYIATPFPGSRLYEDMRASLHLAWNQVRYDVDPYGYPFDLAKARKRAYFGFYLRPRRIGRFIKLFGLRNVPAMAVSAFRFLRSFFGGK